MGPGPGAASHREPCRGREFLLTCLLLSWRSAQCFLVILLLPLACIGDYECRGVYSRADQQPAMRCSAHHMAARTRRMYLRRHHAQMSGREQWAWSLDCAATYVRTRKGHPTHAPSCSCPSGGPRQLVRCTYAHPAARGVHCLTCCPAVRCCPDCLT